MKHLYLTLLWAFLASASAYAEPVQNPLNLLDPNKSCSFTRAEFGADEATYTGTSEKVFEDDEGNEGNYGEDKSKYNVISKADFDRLREFAEDRVSLSDFDAPELAPKMVSNDDVLKSILATYDVGLDFSAYSHQSYRNVVIAALVPCMRTYLKKPGTTGVLSFDMAKSACENAHSIKKDDPKKGVVKSKVDLRPESRFSGEEDVLRARMSLLRLFEAADTGVSNDFVVFRKSPWRIDDIYPAKSSPPVMPDINSKDDAVSVPAYVAWYVESSNYRPLVNGRIDDFVLLKYLTEPDSGMFEVHCTRVYSPEIRKMKYHSEPKTFSYLISAEDDSDVGLPLVTSEATPIGGIGRFQSASDVKWLRRIYEDSKSGGKVWEWSPGIVKDASAFAADGGEAATFGTTVPSDLFDDGTDDGGPEITIEAAFGISREYSFKPNVDWEDFRDSEKNSHDAYTHTNTLTAFYALDRDFIEGKAVALEADGSASLDPMTGLPQVIDKDFSFAEYSVGLRFDSEENYIIPAMGPTSADYLNQTGSKRHGWVYGLTAETIWDEYNIQSTHRIGADISIPERIYAKVFGIGYNQHYNMPGYKEAYALDARGRRPSSERVLGRNIYQALNNGLFVKWDADLLADIVLYDRKPRDFTKVRGYDPKTRTFDTSQFGTDFTVAADTGDQGFLQGAQFNLELSKRNLFGLSQDTAWIALSLDYAFRDDFFSNESTDFHLLEAELKFSDPANSKRSFSISIEDGVDFRTRVEKENQIEFKLGFIF